MSAGNVVNLADRRRPAKKPTGDMVTIPRTAAQLIASWVDRARNGAEIPDDVADIAVGFLTGDVEAAARRLARLRHPSNRGGGDIA